MNAAASAIVLATCLRERMIRPPPRRSSRRRSCRAAWYRPRSLRRRSVSLKRNCRPCALADPVLLHQLHFVRPVLERRPARRAAPRAKSVILRNHWLSLRFSTSAPERQPRPSITCSLASTVRSTGSQLTADLLAIDQARLVEIEEQRLLVPVILGIAGRELAAPVEREAEPLELRLHVGDVLVGPRARVDALLDRGIFGRHAERVPAHRVQHFVPGHRACSAPARRPSCSCGHGRYGCAPRDRGTSPAHSCAACRRRIVGAEALRLVPCALPAPVGLRRIESCFAHGGPLGKISRWRNGGDRAPW